MHIQVIFSFTYKVGMNNVWEDKLIESIKSDEMLN